MLVGVALFGLALLALGGHPDTPARKSASESAPTAVAYSAMQVGGRFAPVGSVPVRVDRVMVVRSSAAVAGTHANWRAS